MKQLTCEMCGSTDLLKDGGVFVCQTCGCKYSVEEAKKMMVEGTVEVTGTVKVDDTSKIQQYLNLAWEAKDANNNEECEKYANQALEIDSENAQAWYLKGTSVAWQSGLRNLRVKESITSWENALNYVEEDKAEAMANAIASDFENVSYAIESLILKNMESADTNFSDYQNLLAEYIVKFYMSNVNKFNFLCLTKKVKSMPFKGDSVKISAERWKEFLDNQGKNVKKAIEVSGRLRQLTESAKGYLVAIMGLRFHMELIIIEDEFEDAYTHTERAMENAFSWLYQNRFPRNAYYNEQLEKTRKAKQEALSKREKIRKENRIKEYWSEHKEEKEKLDKEREQLSEQITELRNKIKTLEEENTPKIQEITDKYNAEKTPAEIELQKQDILIINLRNELRNLGFFKGKEKKTLSERIDKEVIQKEKLEVTAKEERAAKNAAFEADKYTINQEVRNLQNELTELEARRHKIITELTKDR